MTKEELQKHLEIVKKLRDNIRYAESQYRMSNEREKRKLESKYNEERMVAKSYIDMNLRDFIFAEKRSDMEISMWLSELPILIEVDEIANRIKERIVKMK